MMAFKIINDNFGHRKWGDELNSAGFAERIKGSIPSGACFVIAWGGDEFVVVLENIDSIEDLETFKNIIAKCQ